MPKTDISVRELVDKVQRGEMVLPEMQRRFVWPATRVRDLLDSLYRGYPSGTILAWETDEQIETRDLAVKASRTPATSQRLLLLDGQQRVTSLSAILTGQPVHVRRRRRPIEVLFNLEHPDSPFIEEVDENAADEDEEENGGNGERDVQEELRQRTFVVASRALRGSPLWVSVSDVFRKSDRDLLKPIGVNSDDPRWERYAERLQRVRSIASYMYVMQVLEKSLSYEEVTEIFVRVNSLGIKLRSSDLAMAQITSRWRGFMQLVENFCASLEDDEENYLLETNLPVRMLVIFATKQSRFETVGKIPRRELEKAWAQAKEGLEFAVDFVRSNAGIENPEHLSSPLLLVPIATYWVLKSDRGLAKGEQADLLHWLFLAHLRGHYGMGSSETLLDQDLAALKRGGLKALKNQLLLHVKKTTIDPDEVAFKGIRSPIFSTLFFILQRRGAKDWWSGLRLSDRNAGKAHKIQYHHIFPKALLRGKGGIDAREINEIANLAFIAGKTNQRISDKEPKKYLEQVLEKEGKEALEAQLIPLDRSLWETSRFGKFLEWRRAAIAGVINEFMAGLDSKTIASPPQRLPSNTVR